MAEVTFLHYIHKDTFLHRMDSRLKLLCLLLLSLSAGFASRWQHYFVLLAVIIVALRTAKLPLKALLKDMKFFAVIMVLVFISDAFLIPGEPLAYFSIPGVSVQGLETGLRFAIRLSLIIMICTVITGVTSLTDLRNAIEWYLRPVPFIAEARAASMINLTFALIPVIFDNFSEINNAQKSRCIQLRKNPIKRIQFIAFSLLTKTLQRADEIVFAMEARCYSEDRTKAIFKIHKADWLISAVCGAVLLLVLSLH